MDQTNATIIINAMVVLLTLLLVVSTELNRRFYVKLYTRDIIKNMMSEVIVPLIEILSEIENDECNHDIKKLYRRKFGSDLDAKILIFKRMLSRRRKRDLKRIVDAIQYYQDNCDKLTSKERRDIREDIINELIQFRDTVFYEYYINLEEMDKNKNDYN